MVIAGLLHDVVEDEDVTLSDIRHEFSDEVATLVYGASEPEELINAEGGKSKTWPESKAHTIDFIKNADRDMKLLSCADKLPNIRNIIRDYDRLGDGVWISSMPQRTWLHGITLLCWMLLVMGMRG